jgi:signal transduction histidine kinase
MKSIRAALSTGLLLSALLIALILGAVTYRQTLRENEDLFDYQLRQIALSLRNHGLTPQPPAFGGEDGERPQVVIQIWTAAGAIVYLSDPQNPVPDRPTLGFADMVSGGRRWRVFSLPAGDRIIQVAQPLQLRRDLAAAAALRSLLPLLAFAPVMALMIWWLVRHSLRPVRRLADEVARRDAHSLDEVPAQDLPEEIAPLAAALNAMLGRLKKAFASQRAFVADAAHELRSPLAALKIQLQLLDRAQDEAARSQARTQLQDGVERASRLIDQLLTAARTDPTEAAGAFGPVDLAETTRQVMAGLHLMAEQKSIDIALEAADHVVIHGDPDAIAILIRNLVDNAIRYTPAHGAVRATIGRTGTVSLTVEDSGPGIPESAQQRVFDRFYRGEHQQQSGSGLGLSIVKNIADRHGAGVEMGASSLGGLRVVVRFRSEAPAGSRPLLST